jgi:mRNA-degrading endonuclease RelE of RelBE toxin-antitoxin system
MEFSVYITSSAKKAAKKLPLSVREEIVRLSGEVISRNPYDAERLQKPLDECRSFHLKVDNVHYRIAYRILAAERRVDVVLVGTREGFYERLRRTLR